MYVACRLPKKTRKNSDLVSFSRIRLSRIVLRAISIYPLWVRGIWNLWQFYYIWCQLAEFSSLSIQLKWLTQKSIVKNATYGKESQWKVKRTLKNTRTRPELQFKELRETATWLSGRFQGKSKEVNEYGPT